MKKLIISLILTLSVTTLSFFSCSPASNEDGTNSNVPDLELAPDFELTDITGNSVTLQSFRGRSVMLVFWMIQCPACVVEMPYLQEIYEGQSQNDLVLLTINVRDNASQIRDFLTRENLSLPVLMDSNFDTVRDYNVRYTPTAFYIDESGILKYTKIGAYNNVSEIERDINQHIS
jgi:peroxiredoxin